MRPLLISVLGLCACVTPYQRAGVTGGFWEERVAAGVYVVHVRGNGYTRPDTLMAYATQRGNELCFAEGYPHMRLVDAETNTRQAVTPASYYSTTTFYGRQATTYTQRQGGYLVQKHAVSAKAVCMTQEEFDAEQASMRERLLQQ